MFLIFGGAGRELIWRELIWRSTYAFAVFSDSWRATYVFARRNTVICPIHGAKVTARVLSIRERCLHAHGAHVPAYGSGKAPLTTGKACAGISRGLKRGKGGASAGRETYAQVHGVKVWCHVVVPR